MAQSPADRRRAQRRTAREHSQGRKVLPPSTTSRARNAGSNWMDSAVADRSNIRSDEDKKQAARYGSYARQERLHPGSHPDANPEWEAIGEEYYYHDRT